MCCDICRLPSGREVLIPLRRNSGNRWDRRRWLHALSLQDLGLPLVEYLLNLWYPFRAACEIVFDGSVFVCDEVMFLVVWGDGDILQPWLALLSRSSSAQPPAFWIHGLGLK